jgi:hypothetical protein
MAILDQGILDMGRNYSVVEGQQALRNVLNQIQSLIEDPNHFSNVRRLYDINESCKVHIDDLQSTFIKTWNFVEPTNQTHSQIMDGLREIRSELIDSKELLRN